MLDAFTPGTGWRKASRSINAGNCVEAASAGAEIMVRDSADPSGHVVAYPARAWRDFLAAAKAPRSA